VIHLSYSCGNAQIQRRFFLLPRLLGHGLPWTTKSLHSRGSFYLFLLTNRPHFWQNALLKKMIKRPEMRRDGTTFLPRVRGSSESISRAGGAAGIIQERPKTIKEN
jgi:hypothetical protein